MALKMVLKGKSSHFQVCSETGGHGEDFSRAGGGIATLETQELCDSSLLPLIYPFPFLSIELER